MLSIEFSKLSLKRTQIFLIIIKWENEIENSTKAQFNLFDRNDEKR